MPPPDDVGAYYRSTSFARVLADAVADIAESGYVDAERIEAWASLLRAVAERELHSPERIEERMREAMTAIYDRLVERGKVVDRVPGVSRFTLAMIRPALRAELDRRILASADLIKLNRAESIEKTLQRFRGWSTSIPPGGAGVIDKREVRTRIGKSVAQARFEERRVQIDQGAKLASNISEIVATDNGAIAAEWRSHFRQVGYDYREEHRAIDGHIFVVRGNWAIEKGLMQLSGRRYIDDIERPAQLPFCRCFYRWITSLRRIPPDMLTEKGSAWLMQAAERRNAAS
jgi:hypothetical protein